MKLKYYLRGLGLGIIFTTVILMISFWSHRNDISDEEVVRRAERLGMVMKEDNSSIWNKKPEESTAETETSPATEAADGSEADRKTNKDSKKNGGWRQFDTQEGEALAGKTDDPAGTDTASQDKTDKTDSDKADKADKTDSDKADKKVTITIANGDGCRVVAEELMAKGIVEDSEDFRNYMDKKNLDSKLKVGKFSIPKGATYEQIAKIIAN